MKKFIAALILALAIGTWNLPAPIRAQCNGIFGPNTVCGNPATSPALPIPVSPNSFTVGPTGTNGQIQYNASGTFGGFTATGDCTITPSPSGFVSCPNLAHVGSPITFTSAITFNAPVTFSSPVTFATGLTFASPVYYHTNVQSTSYTIQSSDCGGAVAISPSPSALKTVTLPSATGTGFATGCQVVVCNSDQSRGKQTSGFPLDIWNILWPSKCVVEEIFGTAWKTIANQGRWLIPTNGNVCVRQDGSDTSDGLGNGTVAGDCFADMQTAVDIVGEQWDGGGYNACNINLYAGGTGILSGGVTTTGQSIGCFITFNFETTPITITATGSCFTTGDNGIVIVNATPSSLAPTLKCNTANSATAYAFYCHQVCIFDINGGFGYIPAGTNDGFIFLDGQGRATINVASPNGLVVGDGTARTFFDLFHCDEHCSQLQISGNVGFSANVTGTRVFAEYGGSLMNTSASFTGSFSGQTTSIVSGNSVFNQNGTTIPGGVAATAQGIICQVKC
jgi:hypothetical protein